MRRAIPRFHHRHTGRRTANQPHSTKLSNTVCLTADLLLSRSIMIACVSSPSDAAPISNRHMYCSHALHGHRVWVSWLPVSFSRRLNVLCMLLFNFQGYQPVRVCTWDAATDLSELDLSYNGEKLIFKQISSDDAAEMFVTLAAYSAIVQSAQ